LAASTISVLLYGLMNLILPETTSGMAEILLVINIFHIAQASVCTDPNHSDSDGAITQLQVATSSLKSSFFIQLKTWIFVLFTLLILFKIF
jgi:hypothetical protein